MIEQGTQGLQGSRGRRSTGAAEPVGRLGMVLGLFDPAKLHDSTTLLQPEEVLCLFTDGLIESRHDGHMFGPPSACPSSWSRMATNRLRTWPVT